MNGMLFDGADEKPLKKQSAGREGGVPRLKVPVRNQMLMLHSDLDSLIAEEHPVRVVWSFVEKADLSELTRKIKSIEGHAGRPACDPRVLLALWLYATLDAVGSARALEKLTEEHVVYQWLCGAEPVNHHTLSDFRGACGEVLDHLLSEGIAALTSQGLVTLTRVSHDGMRVRASAGGGSFHTSKTLDRHLAEAQEQVALLKSAVDEDVSAANQRQKAARERAARERKERIEKALGQLPDLEKKRKRSDGERRASTTDPDARKMRMADGGWRPAFNVQFTVDTKSKMILSVDVNNNGSDGGQLLPAIQRCHEHSIYPKEVLADGGFVKKEDVETLSAAPYNALIYAPVPASKVRGQPAGPPYRNPTPAIKRWCKRMETKKAKQIYKDRAATSELANAQARNRGLQQFPVRGLAKVKAVALLFALAHNVVRTARLSA